MAAQVRPLALVTGASSGIGFELARCCASAGYDLLIAADEPEIERAAQDLRALDVSVEAVQVDLATPDGVESLCAAAGRLGRPVEALLANAGRGLGGAGFLDQDFQEIRRVVDTNITGTLALVQRIGRQMRDRGQGRILLTGSIAGYMPGPFLAVYNASKAFVDSFAAALRNELKDSGVTVTCLMPGPTETEFFARAEMLDTKVGQQDKDDPAAVARLGFEAMQSGKGDVIHGWKNRAQVALSRVASSDRAAEMHRDLSEPRGQSGS
jgi:short-subunit dehydrogenase